jgi:hypothetical protein
LGALKYCKNQKNEMLGGKAELAFFLGLHFGTCKHMLPMANHFKIIIAKAANLPSITPRSQIVELF